MIPSDVDIANLTNSLSDANVVIEADFPFTSEVSAQSVKKELESATQGPTEAGTVKTAYLTNDSLIPSQLRDVAQAIKDSTGADTVIVQSPSNSAVVSNSASRFTIETHTPELHSPASAENVDAIVASEQAFLSTIGTETPPVAFVNVLVAVALIAAVLCAAAFAVLSQRSRT